MVFVLVVGIVGSACGTHGDTYVAEAQEVPVEGVARTVEEPPAAATGPDTREASDASREGPAITGADVAAIYNANSPMTLTGDQVRNGDQLMMETACSELMGATSDTELASVSDAFAAFFGQQLTAAGATQEFIDLWDTDGMLGDLIELGCVPARV